MATAVTADITPQSTAARSIMPQRSLPSGRAVIGALLVTVAAVGTFVLAIGGETTPDTSYLIAVRPIDAGEFVSLDDLDLMPIDLPVGVDAMTASSVGAVEGSTALRDLRSGELVSSHDLLPHSQTGDVAFTPRHELTFPVPRDRTSQTLVPGDRVTVLATMAVVGASTTFVAVEDAIVLTWNAGGSGVGASSLGVLTLALVDPATVLELTHMAHRGEITVVRTTRAMDDAYPDSYAVPEQGPEDRISTGAGNGS